MNDIKILITRPKTDLATNSTYRWGQEIINYAKALGYNVIDYKKNHVTHNKLNKALKILKPNVYIHFGHGCPSNIHGQYSCIISTNIPEINDDISIDDINCIKSCDISPNVELLHDKIVIAYACHSAKKLGVDAMNHGAKAYIGFDDYLMFITDSINTEELFKDPILNIAKQLLAGNTIRVARETTNKIFDEYIKQYKSVKCLARLLLWDKEYLRFYGDDNLTIFT